MNRSKFKQGELLQFEGLAFVKGELVDFVKHMQFDRYENELAVVTDEDGTEYEVKPTSLIRRR